MQQSPDELKLQVPSLRNAVLLVPRMIGATFSAAVEVFYLTAQNRWPDCAQEDTGRDERVVGRVHWAGCVGDRLHHRLRVTNKSKRTHDFRIVAMPFQGTDVAPEIDIGSQSLAPGQSLDAVLSLTIPDSLAGGAYLASILVEGVRAERLVVELSVKPRQAGVFVMEQDEVVHSSTRTRTPHS